MTRTGLLLATVCAASSLALAQEPAKPAPHPVTRVGAAAVWNPPADTLAALRLKCGEADPTHIERCFLNEMKAAGASPEALAFAESLATSLGVVYLRAFRHVERVDVAYIEYAFRANELEGVLLVNGNPTPIDVDDDRFTIDAEMRKNAAYAALAEPYPHISVLPGDRFDDKLPTVTSIGWGTQSFLVQYTLRDGCRACAEIGTATVAFNFDTQGNFQSARVSNVTAAAAAAPRAAAIPPSSTGFDVAGGVEQIRVLAGKQFSITLSANHTTGYGWRLPTPPDPGTLKQISNEYHAADSGAVGAPGEEVWTFEAAGTGTVQLDFEYVRPFEKDAKPVKTARYSVVIE
ncbi:MAG TPA: protease inhibitor I42 family protein [Candidatus Acidoferrales bacterium]